MKKAVRIFCDMEILGPNMPISEARATQLAQGYLKCRNKIEFPMTSAIFKPPSAENRTQTGKINGEWSVWFTIPDIGWDGPDEQIIIVDAVTGKVEELPAI